MEFLVDDNMPKTATLAGVMADLSVECNVKIDRDDGSDGRDARVGQPRGRGTGQSRGHRRGSANRRGPRRGDQNRGGSLGSASRRSESWWGEE